MNRLLQLGLAVAAVVAAGCGDNAKECGENTELIEGRCVGTGGTPTCTNGTILDSNTNSCVIDPNACQDGTVLIGNECKDPATDVTVDVTEGVEPNGLGLGGESSSTPAGDVTLKPIGQGPLVIRGNLTPRPDRDEDGQAEGDFDTYLFDVATPTLLRVSVDGLGGAAGGFITISDADGLQEWVRFGINTTGDTSVRDLWLPAAGTYAIAVADTRSLVLGTADGGPDANYYVSMEAIPLPTPTAVALTAGTGIHFGAVTNGEVKFFTAPLGTGLNEAQLVVYQDDVNGSLLVSANNTLRALANETKGNNDAPAFAVVGGIDASATVLIAVDQVSNPSNATAPFRLEVTARGAGALSTTGGMVAQNNVLDADPFPGSLDDLAAFYFDATAAGQSLGMDISWSEPVDGLVVNAGGVIVATFSWDVDFSFLGFFGGYGSYTMTDYTGLLRAPAAGRYYFLINAPGASAGDPITATSTITALTPAPLAFGTPVTAVAINAFNSNPYDYTGSASPWQAFTIAADAATNDAKIDYYNVNTTGRLDRLVLDNGGGTFDADDEVSPLFSVYASAAGTTTDGRIMLGQPQRMYAKVNTFDAAGTFDLSVDARTFEDLGTQNALGTVTRTGETLEADGTKRYLIRGVPGADVTVTVTPTALLDVGLDDLDIDEGSFFFVDDEFEGDPEVMDTFIDGRGYLAIEVLDTGFVPGSGTYDISFSVVPPPAPFYTPTAATTVWNNVCTSGTDVTPADRDDGYTDVITLPAGFDFYNNAVTEVVINANGWFSFDTATAQTVSGNATYTPRAFPSAAAPNGLVAPYWTDLANVRICTQTIGTRFIVQWRAKIWGDTTLIAVQAILDTSNDTIEFVYAPYNEGDGAGASAGVESGTGSQGTTVFFDIDTLVPGSSTRLTPQ